ncbi:hypothetical protein BpHYR1_040069 [Brachionus plicatilis]|uniref:Hexosyltransferase n=1 Tax=Brachionus plicatilis TaxID=10195 RepID=A0A3M7RZB7_BRAPC|nr:hypothetical protein BpHYR1_040069 [Brachionus plicatilis]
MARLIYSVTRWWRCYFLLLVASMLSFVLIYVSRNDPNLEYYFPYFRLGSDYYNFYASGGAKKIKKLMEANNLDYELIVSNSKFCVSYDPFDNEPDMDFLVLSISQSQNHKHRIAARSTWAKYLQKLNAKLLFVVGKPQLATNALGDEISKYADMIQINMPDHENYTSTKTLISIRWALTYCSKATNLLIVSDSAVLNLKKFKSIGKQNLINKNAINGQCDYSDENFAKALRLFFKEINLIKKNATNFRKHPIDEYSGQYCSNLGWIISLDGARRLWDTALSSPYMMKISPAYLNGYLAYKAKLNYSNVFKYQDTLPVDKNCLKVFEKQPDLLLCAENFTISSRYSSYIAHWNSPAQGQLNLSKL